jgi:hypothetical protein
VNVRDFKKTAALLRQNRISRGASGKDTMSCVDEGENDEWSHQRFAFNFRASVRCIELLRGALPLQIQSEFS